MRISILTICLLFVVPLFAQEPGDPDYIFTSIHKAMELPEYVYHLDLSKQKRTDFPMEVNQFPELQTLNLSKNKISLIPKEIGELKNLQELNLSKNDISTLPPQIGQLESLEKLILSKNTIQKIPKEIGQLEQLQKIDLWQNEIQEIDPAIGNLPQLNILDLRGMVIPDALEIKLKEWLPETNLLLSNACNCKD